MYVCICKSITDKQIRRAMAGGVMTIHELRETLGVAAGCGSCEDTAQAILDENRAGFAEPALYAPSPA